MKANLPNTAKPSIPDKIKIGVTGHRDLKIEPVLSAQIQKTLENIQLLNPSTGSTHKVLLVLSPLAEGADRMVVQEVLKIPGSELEAILPLKKEDYMKDFNTTESLREFNDLLSKAIQITELANPGERNEAYASAGRYVVDNCDVLIALWDGKPSTQKGGTAATVDYARRKKCPFYWLNTDNIGEIKYCAEGAS